MLHWAPIAFIRITFFFIAGILSAVYFGNYLNESIAVSLVLVAMIGLLFTKTFLRKKLLYWYNWIPGVLAFLAIFLLGYLNLVFHTASHHPDHMLHVKETESYIGILTSPPEEKNKTYQYDLEVVKVNTKQGWRSASGKIHLYVSKEKPLLSYGDKLLIHGSPDEIRPPFNPGAFNYKRFLSFKNIYHQDYLKDNYIKIGHQVPNRLYHMAYKLREAASSIISKHITSERENNIAQALVLGVKDGLDNEITQAYAASGAMHVLAVSGLHVGIVYGVLLLFFKPFRKSRLRNWLLAVISLTVLWTYAMVTGFSPSVLRAVTMFSFLAVAQASGRSTNIYNTLCASAFLLLLFNPYLIMSVGFQLSYLAVFGIVYLQPKLYRAVVIDHYILDKIWAITAVSLAAQLVTAPLTLLYFHQFPTFFLVSNLVVIPGAFIILTTGLSLLIFSFITPVAEVLGMLLEQIIYLVNEIVFFISQIPYSKITDIEITTWQSWLIIIAIGSVLTLIERKKFKYLLVGCVSFLVFISSEIGQAMGANNQKNITLYRVSGHTAIDFIKGTSSWMYADTLLSEDQDQLRFNIFPNRLRSGVVHSNKAIPFLDHVHGMKVITWEGSRILLLGALEEVAMMEPIHFDYVILTKGFNKNIQWLEKQFNFEKVILDGSLRGYRAYALKQELEEQGVKYYSVYHQGALKIDINKQL